MALILHLITLKFYLKKFQMKRNLKYLPLPMWSILSQIKIVRQFCRPLAQKNFASRVDSPYVTSSQNLRKWFFQKLKITYKGSNASVKLSLHYCLYSMKVNIGFLNFWQKTCLKVFKKSFKTRSYSNTLRYLINEYT